ncbi:hypothetical protein, conserved [Babesia ovata]|uniref:C3H1-type domain-containing protein n=1 Tax=Babesia ovata TaxID=189622 RepID=A0A2H6KIW8_9APIC|nr:uncharacterized protein BOVATA_044360 [Babesia ovata]GBE62943.1 hypothetical protein, conserved [Babesia ovata]
MKSLNDELQNAKNSNDDSDKSLISSLESQINDLKSNKDDCTKSHFMDQQRASSLEGEVHHGIDVIVKLTQFSGSEKSIETLINKEIKRLNKTLIKLFDKYCGSAGCCQKHRDTIEQLKKLHDNVNTPEKLSKINFDELKKHLKAMENPVNDDGKNPCYWHHSIDSNTYDNLHSIHTKLLKLTDHRESVTNANNDACKKLLNNLCSGLEKFLGYQETSKGYDGSGIVYSDLDRLCDGVMAFLHGVLETVKDDDNVTKYDKDDALKITKVITTLHDNVGKGREAFEEAVTQVDTLTKSVTSPINDLLEGGEKGNFKNIPQLIKDIQGMQKSNYEDVSGPGGLPKKTQEALKALDSVDKQLSNKLHPHVNLLHNAVDTFHLNVGRDHFSVVKTCERVDEQTKIITDYADKVYREAEEKVGGTLSASADLLNKARKKCKELDSDCRYARKQLAELTSAAEDILHNVKGNALNVTEIHRQIKEVLSDKINDVWVKSMAVDVNIIQRGVEDLLTGVGEAMGNLSEAVAGSKVDTVEGILAKLHGDVRGLQNLLDTTREDLQQALQKVPALSIQQLHQPQTSARKLDAELLEGKLKNAITPPKATAPLPKGGAKEKSLAGKVDAAVAAVKQKVGAIESDFKPYYKSLEKAVEELQAVMKTLKTFSQHVASDSTGVPNDVIKLEDNVTQLQLQFQRLINAVTQVDITNKINALGTALASAKETIIKYIKDTAKQFRTKALTAQIATKREALTQFAQAKGAELSALQQLVTEKKDEIQKVIDNDKATGLKGLMPKIYGGDIPIPPSVASTPGLKLHALITALGSRESDGTKFKQLSEASKNYLDEILKYVSSQVHSPHSSQSHSPQVDRLKQQLDTLLTNLKNSSKDKLYHFDHTFTSDLAALNDALALLTPKQFHGHKHPELLDALTAGAKRLAGELGKQYVNRYSGHEKIDFGKLLVDKIPEDGKPSNEKELTPDGIRLSKVLLTLLSTLSTSLSTLKHDCRTLKGEQINQSSNVGKLLAGHGYIVSEYGKQDGQLRNKKECNGQHIIDLLTKKVDNSDNNTHLKTCTLTKDNKIKFNVMGILDCMLSHLNEYNEVCHLSTSFSKKHPCSVNEMLCWLSGLPHNHIYPNLKSHITSLFEVPDRSDPNVKTVQPVDAHPSTFSYRHVHDALKNMAAQSQNLLRTIRGTGNALITYGCDYTNNSLSLTYPSNPGACFDTLYDILRRLFPVFKFLQIQCTYAGKDYGWRDCLYGNGVDPSSWQCRDHPNTKPTGQANCQPTDQPNGQPTTEPRCQPKSPLMSYLNDCLPGHLPHQLQSVGCTFKCTTCSPNAKGMPCLTPLGFRYFSGSMRTGKELCLLLDDICGNYGVLTGLISMLTCVTVRPPQLFPDIFAFYSMILSKWDNTPNPPNKVDNKSIRTAISDAIDGTIACSTDDANKLLDPCGLLYQSNSHADHNLNNPDLKYLVGCGKQDCGTFMQPLSHSAYSIFAPRHANRYFSCLLYSGWSLVKFLEQLKDAFCSISCADAGCLPCVDTNQCRQGKHGSTDCGCMSMVNCKGVSSVFYKYGLTYANAPAGTRKKCKYFCDTIDRILSSKLLGNFLSAIDELIFTVRENFIWTLLGLWAFSLLYLLHITVVRLDVLRIRSHLRSPSSHRIAAQSLLAAARVKALANVKYFSP